MTEGRGTLSNKVEILKQLLGNEVNKANFVRSEKRENRKGTVMGLIPAV